MTALENLRYFSLLFGIQPQNHQRILEMVGLQNAGKKKASQFSLGMKQRLGIAISLLGNPDFLILDEPINGLDPEGVYEMRKMLERLNREHGTTIMIASHILSELHKLATDYAIIDGGCLIDEFSKDTLESACSSGVQVTVEPEYLQDAKALIASRYPGVRCEVISNQSLRLYEKSIRPTSTNTWWKTRCVCVVWGQTMKTLRSFLSKNSREGMRHEKFNSRTYLSAEKRSFLFRMPCFQLCFSGCIDPAFFFSGISIKRCYRNREVA